MLLKVTRRYFGRAHYHLPTIEMNNGLEMPVIGLGTNGIKDHNLMKSAISDYGYRMLDCAKYSRNEAVVGKALKEVIGPVVDRDELFICSKLWVDEIEDPEKAVKEQLKKMELEYLDLYLVHWSFGMKATKVDGKMKQQRINQSVQETWQKMEGLVDKGLVKSIGVSNFNLQSLWDLLTYANTKPVCNQVELHPYLAQQDLVKYMQTEDIIPMGYMPFANGASNPIGKSLLQDDLITLLSRKHQVTPAQIILNWGIQRGHAVIPKTNNVERLEENIGTLDFELDSGEVAEITKLDSNRRQCDIKAMTQVSLFA